MTAAGTGGDGAAGGAAAPGDPALLERVSHSMFWNALLLPLIAVSNFALAILIRRHFGLESGIYDALIGVLNTLLFYSGVGLPNCLNRFLAELEVDGDGGQVRAFLAGTGLYRFGFLAAVGVPVYLGAGRIAAFLSLGPDGASLLRILLLLVTARAALEFVHRSLQGLLQHLQANLAQLLQAMLAPALLLAAILGAEGLGIHGVFPLLALAAGAAAVAGALWLRRSLRDLDASDPATTTPTGQGGGAPGPPGGTESPGRPGDTESPRRRGVTDASWWPGRLPLGARRLWGYALFMFAFEISNYFVGPGFTSPALLKALGDEAPVALFNVGFQLPLMVTVLVVSSFQGVYRPLFARLLVEGDQDRLRTAFFEVSKVQAFLLVPAAVGLAAVADDLIPLAFGAEFLPAARIAAVLSLLLALETLFNLGSILLSTAQRYRPVAITQALRLLAGPLFVLVAVRADLFAASVIFGLGRAAARWGGYLYARSEYRVEFPWRFLGRLGVPLLLMAVVVVPLGTMWPTDWLHLLGRVVCGVAVFGVAVRLFRVLGPREAQLLERARIPGASHMIALLIPHDRAPLD